MQAKNPSKVSFFRFKKIKFLMSSKNIYIVSADSYVDVGEYMKPAPPRPTKSPRSSRELSFYV
jgi:hypothetical protein